MPPLFVRIGQRAEAVSRFSIFICGNAGFRAYFPENQIEFIPAVRAYFLNERIQMLTGSRQSKVPAEKNALLEGKADRYRRKMRKK